MPPPKADASTLVYFPDFAGNFYAVNAKSGALIPLATAGVAETSPPVLNTHFAASGWVHPTTSCSRTRSLIDDRRQSLVLRLWRRAQTRDVPY